MPKKRHPTPDTLSYLHQIRPNVAKSPVKFTENWTCSHKKLLFCTNGLHCVLLEVTIASFNGQVATPRWNTGISETPLPSPPREFPSFEGGGPMVPRLFYCLGFIAPNFFASDIVASDFIASNWAIRISTTVTDRPWRRTISP